MKNIKLTKGLVANIDDTDFDSVSELKWCAINCRGILYAATNIRRGKGYRTVLMHRWLLGEPTKIVDHVDGNSLNNQRENLRTVTHGENIRNNKNRRNNSPTLGTTLQKSSGKYIAQVYSNRVNKYLGLFTTRELARDAVISYETRNAL